MWNIWRPGAFDGGWLLRRPPAYWLRLQASGVRGRNGGGPLVLEEPDQGTVGPLGTADQATQRLLQGSGRTALQTRASNDGTHYRTSSKVLRPTVLLLNKKKHNWGHPTRDDNWKYSQHHIWKSLSLRKRCIFHFEEFALYGANQSLLQTSVEMPKSLFLVQKNKSTLQKVLAICLLSVTPLVAGQANGWKRSTKKT